MQKMLVVFFLSAIGLLAGDLTGKWTGTLKPTGEDRSMPLHMVFQQEGATLSGSGGPNESEQHPFKEGKVDGAAVKFEVEVNNGKFMFDLKADGDSITGDLKFVRDGEMKTAKVELKRAKS